MRRRWHWLLGLASRRSCYRADGRPKERYPTRAAAERAAAAVGKKFGRELEAYRCWLRCRRWHVGGVAR